jgi:hypothetical protein
VGLEPVPLVEAVSRLTGPVAGQLDPITTRLNGALHGCLQQGAPDARRPVALINMDRFDFRATAASLLQVAEHDQLAQADDVDVGLGYQHRGARCGVDLLQGREVGGQVAWVFSTAQGPRRQ